MKMLVLCNDYRVSDIFRIGGKILHVGKNSLGGVKIHQVGTNETVNVLGQLLTSTIQFLCITILDSSLHVTMKRRAEISAHTFACLLRDFSLSEKNLTLWYTD